MFNKKSDQQEQQRLDKDTASTAQNQDTVTVKESEPVASIDSGRLMDLASFVMSTVETDAATGRSVTLRQASDVFRRMAEGLKRLAESHEGDSTLSEVS